MNLSPRWVDDLKAAGIEAQHWSTIGPADAPDPGILEYALPWTPEVGLVEFLMRKNEFEPVLPTIEYLGGQPILDPFQRSRAQRKELPAKMRSVRSRAAFKRSYQTMMKPTSGLPCSRFLRTTISILCKARLWP